MTREEKIHWSKNKRQENYNFTMMPFLLHALKDNQLNINLCPPPLLVVFTSTLNSHMSCVFIFLIRVIKISFLSSGVITHEFYVLNGFRESFALNFLSEYGNSNAKRKLRNILKSNQFRNMLATCVKPAGSIFIKSRF